MSRQEEGSHGGLTKGGGLLTETALGPGIVFYTPAQLGTCSPMEYLLEKC